MPLVGALELAAAERGGYAVPGFNVFNVEMALGVLDAAEADETPTQLRPMFDVQVAALRDAPIRP